MEIYAPLSGVLVELDQVPDPVFSKRLVGDGVAIDPTSTEVLAPFEGTVSQLHQAHHAVAVRSPSGLEVLVHVGLDTVQLKGRGFTALSSVGEVVRRGQPLLRFDPELLGREARSLLTVVIVTSGGTIRRNETARRAFVRAPGEVLFVADEAPQAPNQLPVADTLPEAARRSTPVRIPNPSGLHARPAAVLAHAARRFRSRLELKKGNASANLKSVISIMGLLTRQGDEVVVEAAGPDASTALEVLVKTLQDGAGEAAEAPRAWSGRAPLGRARPAEAGTLAGVPAAPGVALGRIARLAPLIVTATRAGGTRAHEGEALERARRGADEQLALMAGQSQERARAQILTMQRELLEDPELDAKAREGLDRGESAAWAWQEAFRAQAASLEALSDPLMRERAADLRDVGTRVLANLTGGALERSPLPENAILVAEELTPSELSSLDPARLKGLATTTGSATSHLAIIARGLGVPAVMGADAGILTLPDGTEVVIDGDAGVLEAAPAVNDLLGRARLDERLARAAALRAEERAAAQGAAQTRDGHRVAVVANIRNLAEAQQAMQGGAEGVGLLRSEFMFFDRESAPSEAEQADAYLAIARTVGRGHPLVVRTLDVGGDKPLSYLPLPKEGNPFLGLRGIRVSLDRPELFRAQLRAIAAAAGECELHVMFPMISGLDELLAAKQLALQEFGAEQRVKWGIMVEVPSAAMLAARLAREVDFFSIGTNDLTQYALAMDRGHPQLAKLADALHPGVLRLIALTVEGARSSGRPVHVCGGIASEPVATPLLVGLGVSELSVSVPAVGAVKASLGRWALPECEALAAEALEQPTAAAVRALLATREPGRLQSLTPRAMGA